jgi:hypothetical protein
MSPRRVDVGGGAGRAVAAVAAVVVLGIGLGVVMRARATTRPFDPRSSSPNGTLGLVRLLDQYGAEVAISTRVPRPGDGDRLLVLRDSLSDGQRADLFTFIEDGGIAVVADPASTLHSGAGPEGGAVLAESMLARGRCSVAALEHLERLALSDTAVRFPVGPTDDACFASDSHSFVVVNRFGQGLVVGLGDNALLTNRLLPEADNAAFATALLAPYSGLRVTVIQPTGDARGVELGSGDDTLIDLVRPSLWLALVQAGVAFMVFAVARGIRAGRAISEPLPVPIAGSQLVAATGRLMERAGHVEQACSALQVALHRDLCCELSLPLGTSVDELDVRAHHQLGTAPREVARLLSVHPRHRADLVRFAAELQGFRKERL